MRTSPPAQPRCGQARVTTRAAASQDQWQVVRRVCATLPEGTWTAYGDVSAVTGIHPKPLGNYLATNPVANAWRVLAKRRFRLLGVPLAGAEPHGRAADVLAWKASASTTRDAPTRPNDCPLPTSRALSVWMFPRRPWRQVAVTSIASGYSWPPATRIPGSRSTASQRLARPRRGRLLGQRCSGELLSYSRSGSQEYWPWVFKPTAGTVEVVFKHLLIRPPFDDTAVRDELRQRINRIPDVDVPLSRLELRPTFPLMRLCDDVGLEAAIDVQAWFINRVPTSEADG